MRRTDAIVGAVALAVGAYALKGALALDYFYNGAPGPGFFPRFLALLLILLGGAQLVQAVLPGRSRPRAERDAAAEDDVAAHTEADRTAALADAGGRANLGGLRTQEAAQRVRPSAALATAEPGSRKYLRVATVIAGWIVSIVLLDRLGFLITMVLLVFYLNVVVDRKRGWRPVLAAILIPGAIYLAFGKFLQIQLPVGPFGF